MKIKSLLLAAFALAFSCTAFSQDTTKAKKTVHQHTMAHKGSKSSTTRMKTKKTTSTNTPDSTK